MLITMTMYEYPNVNIFDWKVIPIAFDINYKNEDWNK